MAIATAHERRTSRRRSFLFAVLISGSIGAAALAGLVSAPASASDAPASVATATAPDSALEWTVSPADPTGPDGRVSLRHVVEPGGTVNDHIAVSNLGTSTATLTVQGGDGMVGANGAFDIVEGEPKDSGAWLSVGGLDQNILTLAAGETRVLPVTVSVPAEAAPGDHPAGIVVGITQDDEGVSVTHRIGVRVHLQVAGELAAATTVDAVQTSFAPSWIPFAPGTLTVDMRLENTGNVRVGGAPAVTTSGPFGILATRGGEAPIELLPGDAVDARVELEVWPLFALFGDVVVAPSAIGEDRLPTSAPSTASFTALAVSWTGLAVIALFIGAIVLLARRRRKHRALAAAASAPAEPAEPAAASEPAAPEEAAELAQGTEVSAVDERREVLR